MKMWKYESLRIRELLACILCEVKMIALSQRRSCVESEFCEDDPISGPRMAILRRLRNHAHAVTKHIGLVRGITPRIRYCLVFRGIFQFGLI